MGHFQYNRVCRGCLSEMAEILVVHFLHRISVYIHVIASRRYGSSAAKQSVLDREKASCPEIASSGRAPSSQ